MWYSEHTHEVFPFWFLTVVVTDFPVGPYPNPPKCLQNKHHSFAQIRWKLPQDSNERNRHKPISVWVSCTFWSSLYNGNKTGWDSNKEEFFFFSFLNTQLWNGVLLLWPSQQAALSRPLIAVFGCTNQHAERMDPAADCKCTLRALQKVRGGAFHRKD